MILYIQGGNPSVLILLKKLSITLNITADSIANEDVWEGFDGFDACPVDLFADFGADADVESSPEKKVRSQRKKRYSSGSKVLVKHCITTCSVSFSNTDHSI